MMRKALERIREFWLLYLFFLACCLASFLAGMTVMWFTAVAVVWSMA